MSSENNLNLLDQRQKENESECLKRDLFRYLKYWKWIVFGALLALGFCFLYLRYAPNIYQSNAKIKILKKKESGLDLSGLTGAAPLFDMSTINLMNEIQILSSRRLVKQVIRDLNLNTKYYTTGRIKESEIFGEEVPFKVSWLNLDSEEKINTSNVFIVESSKEDTYKLKVLEKEYNKKHKYGEEIAIEGLKFVIHKNPLFDFELKNKYSEVYFKYRSEERFTSTLLNKILTEPIGDGSEVLEISMTGENPIMNEAIINQLISNFNDDGIEDDKQIAIKTVDFVSRRLDMLESELDTVETDLVEFKSTNNFIGEGTSTSSLIDTYKVTEQKRSELETQLQISRYLQEEVQNNSQYSLLPGNVGLESANTNDLISDYNSLVLQRNKILTSSKESSPQVVELSQQLRLLSRNIEESINQYIRSIQISLQNMSSRERQFNSSIRSIPEKEKKAREIMRQQSVKENLYIFLLQKQVEADLSAAITANTAKVVDYAYSGNTPVSPKPGVVYLAGLVIGLAFPVSILYLIYLFDTKVTSKEQIQAKLDLPIIAEIPINKEYSEKIVKNTDNSNVAEAFRILRTNMNYLNPDQDEEGKCKVIFSTSSTKGEGKTFTAVNAASVFASNNSKTLLIGCDLRNPQLHNYLGVSKKNIGLSSYLVDPELKLNDVIFKTEKDINFDIILSGEIPPNPSELLNNGRIYKLIEEAREIYDYVIIDTAPTMLVTDTLSIMSLADAIVYMVRANFTELKILRHIRELNKFNMKSNVGIAINAVDEKKGYEYNYGYGYGYGIDTKVKKWYNF
jgi:capsular exopolysaccharide synthesis family protein